MFDGHGGAGAAIYAADTLLRLIEETPEWRAYAADPELDDGAVVGKILTACYFEMDRILRIHQESGKGDSSGCTAVCAVVTPRFVICANAGDSRCVIGTGGTTVPLSYDHKPQDDGEKTRIEAAGGTIQWKRVDGDLAVSRAFGDFQYKQRGDLPPERQKVSCEPDISIHRRTPEDDVLILACDGLWDVFSSAEAVELAREIISQGETNPALIAEEMVDSALNKGSKDNISCTIVLLPGCKFGPTTGGGVLSRRAKRDEEIRQAQEADRAANEGKQQSERK